MTNIGGERNEERNDKFCRYLSSCKSAGLNWNLHLDKFWVGHWKIILERGLYVCDVYGKLFFIFYANFSVSDATYYFFKKFGNKVETFDNRIKAFQAYWPNLQSFPRFSIQNEEKLCISWKFKSTLLNSLFLLLFLMLKLLLAGAEREHESLRDSMNLKL